MSFLPLKLINKLLLVFLFFLIIGSLVQKVQAQTTNLGFSIRQDGTILKDGDSFYPFGFYHDSDYQNRYGSTMASDFTKMCQAGFNIVQSIITGPDGINSSSLARDVAKNCTPPMYIIASYYAPSYQTWVNAMKTDPTIMGWNTNDDFNVPTSNPVTSPSQALTKSKVISDYASSIGYNTWTFGSGGGYPYNRDVGTFGYRTTTQIPYLFGDYSNVNNLFGVQSYPISNTDGSFSGAPLEENIAYLIGSKKSLPDNKPLLANLQSFNWGGTNKRYPNAVETRNMVWATIVARLDGILAYSYWHNNGDLSAQTALWNEWKALRQDINGDFLKAVLDGKWTYFASGPLNGQPRIHAATFEYFNPIINKSLIYVIALNTHATASLSATDIIRMPTAMNNASYTIAPLFPSDARYGTGMTIHDLSGVKYLNGTLAAQSVQAYVITLNSIAPTATKTPTIGPSSTPTRTPTPPVATATLAPGAIDPCRSDFNQDGFVDISDYSILISDFLQETVDFADTDINQDGITDLTDYSLFISSFFKVCSYQCI